MISFHNPQCIYITYQKSNIYKFANYISFVYNTWWVLQYNNNCYVIVDDVDLIKELQAFVIFCGLVDIEIKGRLSNVVVPLK